MRLLFALALLVFAPRALAQGPVVGFAYDWVGFGHYSFTAEAGDFFATYSETLMGSSGAEEFDLDASGTTAWSFQFNNGVMGTKNLVTGALTPVGPSGMPGNSIYGLTAHPDGHLWYAMVRVGTDYQLWAGTVSPLAFAPVGTPTSGRFLINLACSGSGQLFSVDIQNDCLVRIDANTGVMTTVGNFGMNINYSSGLDFDWATGKLYGSLMTTVGVEQYFAEIDPVTAALTLQDILPINRQFRFAIAEPAPLDPSAWSAFCNPADPNSTGNPTFLQAGRIRGSAAGCTSMIHGPSGEFGYLLVGSGMADPGCR
ncbi:MAG: hypothetical protein R3F17_05400 [Planctomycetota bacterium]